MDHNQLKREIHRLESSPYLIQGAEAVLARMIQILESFQGSSISKKDLKKVIQNLSVSLREKKIKDEGALEFARKLLQSPRSKASPKKKKDLFSDESFDMNDEQDFPVEEPARGLEDDSLDDEELDESVASFFGINQEEDEDDDED